MKIRKIEKYIPIERVNHSRYNPYKYTPPQDNGFHPEYLQRVQQRKQNIFSKFFRFVRALYYANIKYR